MGKKGKKKLKTGHQERKVSSASPRASYQQSSTTSKLETSEDATIVKDKRTCPHLDKGVNLEKLSAKLKSSETIKCEDCREGGGRGSKGKAKQGKKNVGEESRLNSKAVWVCLDCGHYSCGGIGYPTTPHTHAARHARLEKHPLALQYGKPLLRWCFPCEMLIRIEKSKEGVDQKDMLHDVIKMMKVQPSDAPADTGDVCSGSASVISGVISESTFSLSRKSYSVKGLVNLGNTCFFNSVMQNLLALSLLREYFCKLDGSFGPLTAALKKLITETYPESGLKNVVNPRSFFGSICTKAPQFRGYQQQDSHELLRCLLDGLSTEELSARKLDKSFEKDGKSDPVFVDAIFGGQLSSSVTCSDCQHSSLVYEPFLDISLPVPTKKPLSRKPQQTARAKKPKAPPKKNTRFRESDIQPFQDASADGQLPCTIASCAISGENVVPSGDPASLVCSGAGVTADNKSLITNSILSTQLPESSKASENVITSTSGFSWLDVLDADTDEFLQMDDPLISYDPRGENAVMDDVPMQDSLECSGEDVQMPIDAGNCSSEGARLDQQEQGKFSNDQASNLPPIENLVIDDSEVRNVIEGEGEGEGEVEDGSGSCSFSCSQNLDVGFESSEKVSEEEAPLLLQDSEVLLLPYKEDIFAASEMRETGAEVTLSALDNDQDSFNFDGFGDLFTEPEVENPSMKSSEIDNASEENQGLGAGFGGNASESEPDEVDNSNSPVSVESCLSYFTKPELLLKKEHAWQCENCSKVLQEQKRELRKKLQNSRLKHVANNNADKSTAVLSHLYWSPGNLSQPSEARDHSGVLDTSDSSVMLDAGEIEDKRTCRPETGEKADNNPVATCLAEQNCELEAPACESSVSRDVNFSNLNDYRNCNGCHVDEPKSDGFVDGDVRMKAIQPESLSCKAEGEEDQEEKQEIVKVERDATKRILISRAPPILTIHLKRFCQDTRGRLSKLNGFVQFNQTIDLKPFMDSSCAERDRSKYQLVGLVEHSGTMRGGHYVAYVRGQRKNPPGPENEAADYVWYHASDAYVREASLNEVLQAEAYILFYERI